MPPIRTPPKYSLDDLFRIVLTQSYYAPIDSTSNHCLMNSTARFLAEMAYPGQGDRYHGGNDGRGQDWIGGPNNENPTLIDYNQWPMLKEQFVAGGSPLINQEQGGNLTVSFPGTLAAFYDLTKNTLTTGTNINLTVTSNAPATATLAWNASLGQTGWQVERSTNGAAWTTVPAAANLPANASGFTDTGLTQGASYDDRVTPLGTPFGPSAPGSTSVDFAAPSNLQIQVTAANALKLTWTNNAVGAVNTRLQYAEDGSEQWTTFDNRPPTQNLYGISNIPAGTRRFYRVLAVSSTASSDPTARVGAEVSASYVGVTLSMPEYLTAVGNASQVVLSWKDTATNETGYRVERSADGGTTWVVLASALPANSAAYTDKTVLPGASYTYRVAATAGTTLSASSSPVTAVAGP